MQARIYPPSFAFRIWSQNFTYVSSILFPHHLKNHQLSIIHTREECNCLCNSIHHFIVPHCQVTGTRLTARPTYLQLKIPRKYRSLFGPNVCCRHCASYMPKPRFPEFKSGAKPRHAALREHRKKWVANFRKFASISQQNLSALQIPVKSLKITADVVTDTIFVDAFLKGI